MVNLGSYILSLSPHILKNSHHAHFLSFFLGSKAVSEEGLAFFIHLCEATSIHEPI